MTTPVPQRLHPSNFIVSLHLRDPFAFSPYLNSGTKHLQNNMSAASFPQFLELPIELQIKIWKEVLPKQDEDPLYIIRPIQRHWPISPFLSRRTKLVGPEWMEWVIFHTYFAALRICWLSRETCLSWLKKRVEVDMYLLPRVDQGLWGRRYGQTADTGDIG